MTDPVRREVAASNSTAAETAGWLVLSRVLLAAAAAAAGLIGAAVLGPSGRGEVAVGLLIGYAGAVLGILGLENSLVAVAPGRGFAESYGLATNFARRSLPLAVVMTILAAVGGHLEGWYRWDAAFAVLGVAVGTAAVRLASTAGAAAGDSRRQTNIALVSGATLVLGAVVLGSIGDASPTNWLWLYSISTVLGVVVARLPRRRSDDHDARVRDLRAHAVPALAPTATNFLTLRADRLLLPLLTDTAQLGVYVVASTMVDVVTLPAKSATQVLAARWRIEGPPPLGRTLAIAFVASAVPAAALVIFGRSFLPWALGSAYDESARLLLILGPAVACYLITRAVHARQLALGNQWAVSNSESAGFVVAIIAYLAIIPFAGATGAALGSLLGYASSLVVGIVLTLRTERRATSTTATSTTIGSTLSSDRIT